MKLPFQPKPFWPPRNDRNSQPLLLSKALFETPKALRPLLAERGLKTGRFTRTNVG